MLVLSRKPSQAIQLGDEITITVIRTSQGSVKLGIHAPPDVRILRVEIDEQRRSQAIPEPPQLISSP